MEKAGSGFNLPVEVAAHVVKPHVGRANLGQHVWRCKDNTSAPGAGGVKPHRARSLDLQQLSSTCVFSAGSMGDCCCCLGCWWWLSYLVSVLSFSPCVINPLSVLDIT